MNSRNIKETVSVNMSANGDSPDDIITMMNRIFTVGGQKQVTSAMMPNAGPAMPVFKSLDVAKDAGVDEDEIGDMIKTPGFGSSNAPEPPRRPPGLGSGSSDAKPSAPSAPSQDTSKPYKPTGPNDPYNGAPEESLGEIMKLAGMKHDAITDEDEPGFGRAKPIAPGTVPVPDDRPMWSTAPTPSLSPLQMGAQGREIAKQAATPAGKAQAQAAGLNGGPADQAERSPTSASEFGKLDYVDPKTQPKSAAPATSYGISSGDGGKSGKWVDPVKPTAPTTTAPKLPGTSGATMPGGNAMGTGFGLTGPTSTAGAVKPAAPGAAARPTIGPGGKVSADQLNQFRQTNPGATLGQYMNAAQGKTAVKGGANDPSAPGFKGAPTINAVPGGAAPAAGAKPGAAPAAKPGAAPAAPVDPHAQSKAMFGADNGTPGAFFAADAQRTKELNAQKAPGAAAPGAAAPKAPGAAPVAKAPGAAAPTPTPRPQAATPTPAPRPQAASPAPQAASPIGIPTAPKPGGGALGMAPSGLQPQAAPATPKAAAPAEPAKPAPKADTGVTNQPDKKDYGTWTETSNQYSKMKAEYDQLLAEYSELKRIKDLARGIQQLDERGPGGYSGGRSGGMSARPSFSGAGAGRSNSMMPNLRQPPRLPQGNRGYQSQRSMYGRQQPSNGNIMQNILTGLAGGVAGSLFNPQQLQQPQQQQQSSNSGNPVNPGKGAGAGAETPAPTKTPVPLAPGQTANKNDTAINAPWAKEEPAVNPYDPNNAFNKKMQVSPASPNYVAPSHDEFLGALGVKPNAPTEPAKPVEKPVEKPAATPPVAVPTTSTTATPDEVKAAVAPRVAADAEKRANGSFDITTKDNPTGSTAPNNGWGAGESVGEEFENEPRTQYSTSDYMNMMLSGGLNGPKKTYPKVAKGDNPMQQVSELVLRNLTTEYQKFRND